MTAGFYAGSTAVSLYSDEYRQFFVEHVPLGERIIDFTDSQGWDRAPVKIKLSQALNGTVAATSSDIKLRVKEKVDDVQSKASHKVSEIKDVTSKKIHNATDSVSESYQKAKEKVKETTGKAFNSVKSPTEPKKDNQSAQSHGIKFSEGVEELVQKAENALKIAVADVVPTPSVPPLAQSNAIKPAPSTGAEADQSEDILEETLPSNVYSKRLPIGFEPPPGYVVRPQRKPASNKRSKKPSTDTSAPLLVPHVAPFASSEPVIGQLASTIDALTRLIETTPSSSANASSYLEKAKFDLTNLARKLDSVRAEEHAILEKKLEEQARIYNEKLRDLESKAQEKFEMQEKGWMNSFNEEQQKQVESFKKKLESELETQSELINRR